jgi:hypothetical protein
MFGWSSDHWKGGHDHQVNGVVKLPFSLNNVLILSSPTKTYNINTWSHLHKKLHFAAWKYSFSKDFISLDLELNVRFANGLWNNTLKKEYFPKKTERKSFWKLE